jgi:hypothetical protein
MNSSISLSNLDASLAAGVIILECGVLGVPLTLEKSILL